jgi:hypothetical protein
MIVNNIAMWDGTNWNVLGNATNNGKKKLEIS